MQVLIDSPFAVLSFLAAPAVLTNASTVLALGTSNRLARAADRARLLSARLLGTADAASAAATLERKDFDHAIARARMLVRALRAFYFAAGAFAASTCVALLGAIAGYFGQSAASIAGVILTTAAAFVGVGALALGSLRLVAETRVALRVLADEEAAIDAWAARRAEGR
jgi:hypothetical protein